LKNNEQTKILATCQDLAKIVFCKENGRPQPHYAVIIQALQNSNLHDTGLQLLDDVAAIVQIGLDTGGLLSPDMLDTLEDRIRTLITALSKR
jgi:hypothetical protein